jgi:hypothetical protein
MTGFLGFVELIGFICVCYWIGYAGTRRLLQSRR